MTPTKGRVNFNKFFGKKEAAIERAMDRKERSIEFANALNNAVLVITTLAAHPELNMDDILQDILDLVKFFRNMKDEVDVEDAEAKKLVTPEAVQEVFPGSEVVQAGAPAPQGPKDYTIKDPQAPITPAQQRMIGALSQRLGVPPIPLSGYTKAGASSLIEKLLAQEKTSGRLGE